MASLQIQHFTHPHLLHKLSAPVAFNCKGCNTARCGIPYRCSACNFDLHEECATAPSTICSHHHPQHHLTLLNRQVQLTKTKTSYRMSPAGEVLETKEVSTFASFFCDVCGKDVGGLCYSCPPCGFDAHLLCTKFPVASLPWSHSLPVHQYHQQHHHQGSSKIASKIGKIVGRIVLSSVTGGLLN